MFSITIKIGSESKTVKSVKDIAKVATVDAKVDTTHKLNAHCICILVGIIITIVCTFIDVSVIFHITALLGTLPAIAQEAVDWIHDW